MAMAPVTHRWYCRLQLLMLCVAVVAVDGTRIIAQEGSSGRATSCKSLAVKTLKCLSPPLTAKPGQANNKYFPAEFPAGHIGIQHFHAELVDHNRIPVPLSQLYLHHFVMTEFYVPKGHSQLHLTHLLSHMRSTRYQHMPMNYDATASEDGEDDSLAAALPFPSEAKRVHAFGKGGETRRTELRLPEPYVIESGKEIEGYETAWVLNVHGLDTRGAVNRMGCVECRCDLFNATTDEDGNPLPEGYIGGLRCCRDGQRCAVEEGYDGGERIFHLEYTWEYFDWSECLIPTSMISIDITNHGGYDDKEVEFTIPEGCGDADPSSEECVDTREVTRMSPLGGELVHSVSHLHASAVDSSVWGEDGRLICRSTPMYGHGEEAGNEKDYVVGITSCYGNPNTPHAVRVKQGEKLKYVVKYSKVGGPHTGLMGIGDVRLVVDHGVQAAY